MHECLKWFVDDQCTIIDMLKALDKYLFIRDCFIVFDILPKKLIYDI